MRYKCICGNSKCKISFASFKQGHRCMECSGKEKLTFKFVYNYFKEHDCELLETEYINNHTPLKYYCLYILSHIIHNHDLQNIF